MKIAFPVSEKSIESDIYDSFGRAPYFVIYNTISKDIEYLDHRAVVAQGAGGIRAAQVLVDQGIKVIIAQQCGENAEKLLRKAEVLIYKASVGSIRDNIEAYLNDQLNLLNEFKFKKTDL
ncbi:NifB/NifX family molybdenum-iron cluster-binding protein [Sinanaerobacter chloroacetimidivorans]|uniref:NifB/NifX family molybdenum-iron cluster-binding protein n=1 Tax=Sinanaerobacter chloroacetimidivorans TaxID=2818044 RepID=A0A8J8B292_9FIRM|nr:NifB/NifX family molybdenum-iron cluster-binding protein [Sinanaerobacter chloroacetimidivorans]MBR0598526.1 NifB/NifX family molybdenum-iron cluster-binding protein [Sinanaerobacter chloroacetimidivorans]